MSKSISIICDFCKTQFIRDLKHVNSNIKRGRANFCSRNCQNNDHTSLKIKPCLFCSLDFKPKTRVQKFCSSSCSGLFHNPKIIKEKIKSITLLFNSKLTLGDLKTNYSLNQYHAKLRMWSRKTYLSANLPMVCNVCNYTLHINVCHIKDIKNFPLTALVAEVNHITNLVALCPNHHWEFDNNFLDLNKISGDGI